MPHLSLDHFLPIDKVHDYEQFAYFSAKVVHADNGGPRHQYLLLPLLNQPCKLGGIYCQRVVQIVFLKDLLHFGVGLQPG